jgi:hypothetical protein
LHRQGAELLRPACSSWTPRLGQALLAPIRLFIESVYDTLKGRFDVELHGGRSRPGVTVRIAQRLVGLTAAIWHNRVAVGTARTRRWNPIRSADEAQGLAARGGGTLGFALPLCSGCARPAAAGTMRPWHRHGCRPGAAARHPSDDRTVRRRRPVTVKTASA